MNDNTLGTNFNVFYSLLDAPMQLKEKLKVNSKKFAVSFDLKEIAIF